MDVFLTKYGHERSDFFLKDRQKRVSYSLFWPIQTSWKNAWCYRPVLRKNKWVGGGSIFFMRFDKTINFRRDTLFSASKVEKWSTLSNDPIWRGKVGATFRDELRWVLKRSRIAWAGFVKGGTRTTRTCPSLFLVQTCTYKANSKESHIKQH